MMPISVQGHHSFVDCIHVGEFVEDYMKKKMYDFKRIGIDEIEMIKELFTFGV